MIICNTLIADDTILCFFVVTVWTGFSCIIICRLIIIAISRSRNTDYGLLISRYFTTFHQIEQLGHLQLVQFICIISFALLPNLLILNNGIYECWHPVSRDILLTILVKLCTTGDWWTNCRLSIRKNQYLVFICTYKSGHSIAK